jgi:signal peptidase II
LQPLCDCGQCHDMTARFGAVLYCLVIVVVVAADQLTKTLVVTFFSLYESREIVPGFFNLVYVTNPGAAFSMLAKIDSVWRHYFFLGVGCCAVIGISWYSWKMVADRWRVTALAMIAGGALGNLIDRIRFGAVVDFLDFYLGGYHWPAFNVADSAICVGAAMYLWVSFIDEKQALLEDKK